MEKKTTSFDNLSSFLPKQFKRESGGNPEWKSLQIEF
jgi:hypothetical protein